MQILLGSETTVVYSKPSGVLSLGPSAGFMAELMASQAMINEISWIKDLTSLGLADWDRSWLSLASRLGCCETWTFEGKLAMIDDDIGISGGDVGRV